MASLRAIAALALREMTTTYGRSPGGYLWAVIEPVAGIAILTFASSLMVVAPPLGQSFELFYATGMLPFLMFTMIANRVGASLLFSRPLLIYPAVTFLDAILARFAVTLLTEILVFVLVTGGVLMWFPTGAVLAIPHILQALALCAALGLAVGAANAYLFLRWHVWHVLWSVISRPLFLVSGVFFTFSALPEPLQSVLWFNPLVHVIAEMRAGFYPGYGDDYAAPLWVAGVSLTVLVGGLFALHRHARWLLHEA